MSFSGNQRFLPPKQSAQKLDHTSLMGVVDALAVALAGLRSCCRPCRVHHQCGPHHCITI